MRKAIAIIGEGITEKYYIESLKGLSPFTIFPKELGRKASNLKTLESQIKDAIEKGYDEVFCLIDMDGKSEGKSKTDYVNLKTKYYNKIFGKKSKDIQSKVIFIETERCMELWFLYHFAKSAITRNFASYEELEKELHKYRPNYQKTEKYFRSVGNLHLEFTTKRIPNGSLKQAVQNSENSIISKSQDDRNHTYSEMHILIEALKIPH
jgi:hypothetical protein